MKHTALALLLACSAARAHDGHGLSSASHWHATEAFGLLALALVVAGVLWWRSRK